MPAYDTKVAHHYYKTVYFYAINHRHDGCHTRLLICSRMISKPRYSYVIVNGFRRRGVSE